MNCWEVMCCGREKSGTRAHLLGVCPAYPEHGSHCALVAGTHCGARAQGTFADKMRDCGGCVFYNSFHYDHAYRMPEGAAG